MKKLVLFLFLLFFCSGTMFSQQLSYRFANPRIIRLSTYDYFQFDVQIKCSVPNYYLWVGQINLNFNSTTFNTNGNNWSAVIPQYIDNNSINGSNPFYGNNSNFKATPKYTVTATITGSVYNIGISGDAGAALNVPPTAADFTLVPTVYTTIVTVSARLASLTPTGDELAGFSFLPASMDGKQQYISNTGVFTGFTSTNSYDTRDFVNDYIGRFYSTLYGWSQIGSATINVQNLVWATPVSTTIWEGAPTIPSGTIVNNLIIDNPATITIPQTGTLTVTGNTNVQTPGGLTILSDNTGTGSFITGTASGIAASTIAQRYMVTGKWNIVSSPVSGSPAQTVANFITSNAAIIPFGTGANTGKRGMMDYDPINNIWNPYFTDGSTNGSLVPGRGFSLRVNANAAATFTGVLQAGTGGVVSVAGLTPAAWNCVGNPYTSAIAMNSVSTSGATNNFLTVNVANVDPTYGAIYIWTVPDLSNTGLSGLYSTYSNVNTPLDIQQGQAFMIKTNTTATALTFNKAMQFHSTGLALKTKQEPWPSINLTASVGDQKSKTLIAFNHDMTKGLDPTYDAGLLKGPTDLLVYSRLVEGDATPFAIQALPDNESNMVIPIGVDFKTGGEVVFSSEMMNLPKDCKVVLEDVLNKTFTDLSKDNYKVVIAANSSITDRFFLHTTFVTTKPENQVMTETLNAYAVGKTEIRVIGQVSSKAIATLYDIHGRDVLVKNLEDGSLNVIPLPSIKVGVYMLNVIDNGKRHSFKILIGE